MSFLGKLLVVGTLLSIIGFGIGAMLLYSGAADPPRAEKFYWEDRAWTWITSPQLLPKYPFTLEVAATVSKEHYTAWGIWFETIEGNWLVVALNSFQYITVRICPSHFEVPFETCYPVDEPTQKIKTYWKTFRFIQPFSNQLRLNYKDSQLSIWINQEWMWDIESRLAPNYQWGVWSSNPVEWQTATIWVH